MIFIISPVEKYFAEEVFWQELCRSWQKPQKLEPAKFSATLPSTTGLTTNMSKTFPNGNFLDNNLPAIS